MMDSRDAPKFFVRLWMEGLVIVVSILAAFLLDAWWADRGSRIELAQEVANVRSELQQSRQRVELEIEKLDRIAAGGDQIRQLMDADPDAPTVIVPDSLAWLATVWAPTLDVSLGAVDALIASGRLAQIGNPELRSGLAGIKGYFEDAVSCEEKATGVLYDFLYPEVFGKIDLRPVYQIEEENVRERRYSAGVELPSHATVAYPNNLAIRNSIMDRTSWLRSGKDSMQVLMAQLDRLIALTSEQ